MSWKYIWLLHVLIHSQRHSTILFWPCNSETIDYKNGIVTGSVLVKKQMHLQEYPMSCTIAHLYMVCYINFIIIIFIHVETYDYATHVDDEHVMNCSDSVLTCPEFEAIANLAILPNSFDTAVTTFYTLLQIFD